MSRTFCCCIPVRAGVFITSLLAFLFTSAGAGGSAYLLLKTKDENDPRFANLTGEMRTTLIVVAVVNGIIALSSLFGFIGSVMRKRSFVAIYSTMTFVLFLIQSATDGYLIYELFRKDSPVQCVGTDAANSGDSGTCKDVVKDFRIGFVMLVAIAWLLQLYICIIIKRYVQQLDQEQSYNRTTGYVDSAFKMGPTNAYYPHQPLSQGDGLLAPKVDYPYTDPHHSHGSYAGGY